MNDPQQMRTTTEPTIRRRQLLGTFAAVVGFVMLIATPAIGLYVQQQVAKMMGTAALERVGGAATPTTGHNTPGAPMTDSTAIVEALDQFGPSARRHLRVLWASTASVGIESHAWPARCLVTRAPRVMTMTLRCGWQWQSALAIPPAPVADADLGPTG